MNKKNCEDIGYFFSITHSYEEIKQMIFGMDERIEPQFEAYEEIQGRSEEVDKLANKLMQEVNPGYHDWFMLRKECLNRSYKDCLDEARRTIYGDDYKSFIKGEVK